MTDALRNNIDASVVEGFGLEWSRFDQSQLNAEERDAVFEDYFRIFPWDKVGPESVGADIGCGSGRWAAVAARRVGRLHCVDASSAALAVAKRNAGPTGKAEFHLASVDDLPFAERSLDFAYSLGVLHHVPDTAAAINSVARTLKPGAPLLLYLYYAFDDAPAWFRALWKASDFGRRAISRLPGRSKPFVTDLIAFSVYWPLSRMARALERMKSLPGSWPLSYYRDKSVYTLRTDALDRFGTRLEQRFTRAQISEMMRAAGLTGITFSDTPPFWCAVGYKL